MARAGVYSGFDLHRPAAVGAGFDIAITVKLAREAVFEFHCAARCSRSRRLINLCIAVDTQLTPHRLLARAQAVERALGRERAKEQRWGPRPIDIDLLAYNDLALEDPDLTLPHPRLFARAFVLAPLAEIAPERVIAGVRVREALAQLDASGIERLAPAENQG